MSDFSDSTDPPMSGAAIFARLASLSQNDQRDVMNLLETVTAAPGIRAMRALNVSQLQAAVGVRRTTFSPFQY